MVTARSKQNLICRGTICLSLFTINRSGLHDLKEAENELKDLIKEYQAGDKMDRLMAKVLTSCREGDRCHLLECPVCEYERDRGLTRVLRAPVEKVWGMHLLRIDVAGVEVRRHDRRPLNKAKVKLLAASMTRLASKCQSSLGQ